MSEAGFLSSALRLFTGGDGAEGESEAADASRAPSSRNHEDAASERDEAEGEEEDESGQTSAAAQRAASIAAGVSASTAAAESAPVSIRLATAIRGSVREGGRSWPDEPAGAGAGAAGAGAGASGPTSPGGVTVLAPGIVTSRRLAEFTRCLETRNVNTETLRRLAWFGVPSRYRTATWQILLGHLPASAERAQHSLARKREEYESFVAAMSGRGGSGMGKSEGEQRMVRQVLVDCPRTCPGIPLFHTKWVQKSLARVLTAYASRHFATGYVQGLNDLACPFYAVFLSPWADLDSGDTVIEAIPAEDKADVESDVYWCLTRTIEGIQSHYLNSQPGLHSMMSRLRELCVRVDGESPIPRTPRRHPPSPPFIPSHAPLVHPPGRGMPPHCSTS